MIIIGIDPGSHKTGWSIIKQDMEATSPSPIYIASGVIEIKKGTLAERCAIFHKAIVELIREYHPNIAGIEETIVGHAAFRSALILANARGAIMAALAGEGLAVVEFPPTIIKKCITGSGGAKKEAVSLWVERYFNVSAKLDESDALAVGFTTVYSLYERLPGQ